jgi:threonylcarbamoyladenosine tRNA methylthiotransferase MtaB
VPKVRTYQFCLPASQIITTIQKKVTLGYREVILTGTKIGCYKDDGADLATLVEHILRDTKIERLRLSSLQPQEISPALLALWQDERLCPHLHLVLQSGSDTVLHRMRRRYSLNDYQKAISLIREAIPKVAITTDIIVGFPGESDAEFEQSYNFCRQATFANIHVFPFSPRPTTEAAKMPEQISDKVKKERTHRMVELAQTCRHNFQEQFLGQTTPVLWEKETKPGSGLYSGLTGNYIRVFTQSEKPLTNKIVKVNLAGFYNHGMWGKLVNENSG